MKKYSKYLVAGIAISILLNCIIISSAYFEDKIISTQTMSIKEFPKESTFDIERIDIDDCGNYGEIKDGTHHRVEFYYTISESNNIDITLKNTHGDFFENVNIELVENRNDKYIAIKKDKPYYDMDMLSLNDYEDSIQIVINENDEHNTINSEIYTIYLKKISIYNHFVNYKITDSKGNIRWTNENEEELGDVLIK